MAAWLTAALSLPSPQGPRCLPRAVTAPQPRSLHPLLTTSLPPPEDHLISSIRSAAVFARLCEEKDDPTAPVTDVGLRRAARGSDDSLTTALQLQSRIEEAASTLERTQPPLDFSSPDEGTSVVEGTWRLLYSNASEITNLADLPFGFRLREVHQRIDLSTGALENRATVGHKLRLASQRTRVVARSWADTVGTISRAGVVNTGNRLAVQFTKVVISLQRILFIPTPFLRVTARPNGTLEKVRQGPGVRSRVLWVTHVLFTCTCPC